MQSIQSLSQGIEQPEEKWSEGLDGQTENIQYNV